MVPEISGDSPSSETYFGSFGVAISNSKEYAPFEVTAQNPVSEVFRASSYPELLAS